MTVLSGLCLLSVLCGLLLPAWGLAREGDAALSLTLSFPSTHAPAKGPGEPGLADNELKVTAGKAVKVRWTIANQGKKPWALMGRFLRVNPGRFHVTAEDGEDLMTAPDQGLWVGPKVAVVRLAPGESFNAEGDLLDIFPPDRGLMYLGRTLVEPGTYCVALRLDVIPAFEENWGPDFWRGILKSNELKLRVQPVSAEAREQLWTDYVKAGEQEKRLLAATIALSAGRQWDPRVTELLSSPVEQVRCIVADAAARVRPASEDVAKSLEKLLGEDGSASVRCSAARALGRMGLQRSIPVLIEHVKNHRGTSYMMAIRALGFAGDPRGLPVLREVLEKDSDKWVRKSALMSIAEIEARAGKKQ